MPLRPSIPPLSKSRFMSGLQCHKRLWLQLFRPELAEEADAATQAMLDQGSQVGALARGYYPGGELIDEDHQHLDQALTHTQRALGGAAPALYEATVRHDDVLMRVDILARAAKARFDLVEVKSSTQPKDEHYWDVAIQAYVAQGAGMSIGRKCLLLIDRDYVYPGGAHDLHKLFALYDVSREVDALVPQVPKLLEAMRAPLWEPTPPDMAIGAQCYTPYECPFIGACHPPGPEHPVSDLYRVSQDLKDHLAQDGIAAIPDIPEDYPGLSATNARIREAVISGRPFMDGAIRVALRRLKSPVFFMDFETFSPAIPLYAGTRPYDTIPFQWSAHRIGAGGSVEHFEYLHEGTGDPRPEFARTLLEALGTEGSVCVYSGFEAARLNELRALLPERAQAVDALLRRLVDLLPLVREHVYHPQFHGSYSIKSVYPALVPKAGYDDLAISDGGMASAAYPVLISPQTPAKERKALRRDLLAYCQRDTQALLDLYRTLVS